MKRYHVTWGLKWEVFDMKLKVVVDDRKFRTRAEAHEFRRQLESEDTDDK
jgi:hypothetical protein